VVLAMVSFRFIVDGISSLRQSIFQETPQNVAIFGRSF